MTDIGGSMMGCNSLLQEVGDDVFDIHESDVKITVDHYFVGFALIAEFLFGFFDALFEAVFAFGIAIGETANEGFLVRWCYVDDESVIAKFLLDVLCTFDIYVVEYDLAFAPDALYLTLQ